MFSQGRVVWPQSLLVLTALCSLQEVVFSHCPFAACLVLFLGENHFIVPE